MPDGSWQVLFWQGEDPRNRETGGFSFLGRAVYDAKRNRLAVNWQSLPGSCCPGRGRAELTPLDPKSFKFSVFAPNLEQGAWPVLGDAKFTWTYPPVSEAKAASLLGGWKILLWYEDMLPGGAPADQVEGLLQVSLREGAQKAQWLDRPGEVTLGFKGDGLDLAYSDLKAGYGLNAVLRPLAGGLAYAGRFHSTLGRGSLQMVRAGLPASPPGAAAAADNLAGTWVDPRTGSDFFEITGSARGFDFISYGGSKTKPRYLTKGSALPLGDGGFQASAADVEGYCCGNRGKLLFNLKDDNQMEVRALWWPKGQAEPQTAPDQPYVIRKQKAEPGARGRIAAGAMWPAVRQAAPGLLGTETGAVEVAFNWAPQSGPRDYTLFSQGGYLRDMDLFIDPGGRLAARITTRNGELALSGNRKVEAGRDHLALLTYRAGGHAVLYLDGEEVGRAGMPAAWTGSNSPYLAGGSRWPGRSFEGSIKSVRLWAKVPEPEAPAEPELAMEFAPAGPADAGPKEAGSAGRTIMRLWNPVRLLHAYAVRQEQIEILKKEGYLLQGPVGKLAAVREEGTEPLFAFRHRALGYYVLARGAKAPEGCDSLGLMGFIWANANPETTKLESFTASFPEPVRGGRSRDTYYTSRPENAQAAGEAGYGGAVLVGYVKPAKEPDFVAPLLYEWNGSWRGEGWGRFFMKRDGDRVDVFWYYGRMDSPHYFGRYRLEPGGRRAKGYAVGNPGAAATYYRQELSFADNLGGGPGIKVRTWRLAAPTDDGKMVLFRKPGDKDSRLIKTTQAVPFEEGRVLNRFCLGQGWRSRIHHAEGAGQGPARQNPGGAVNMENGGRKSSLREALAKRYKDLWPDSQVGGDAMRSPLFPGAGKAAERLRRLPEYKSCQVALIMADPPLLQARINLLNDNKTMICGTPGLKQGLIRFTPGMLPLAKRSTSLRGHQLAGSGQPLRPPEHKLPAVGLMIVSALAADQDGRLLGDGRGLADFLAALLVRAGAWSKNAKVVAMVADEQIMDRIPAEPWDVPAHLVVTPDRVIRNQAGMPEVGLANLPDSLAGLPLARNILGD